VYVLRLLNVASSVTSLWAQAFVEAGISSVFRYEYGQLELETVVLLNLIL
jgi:hypothetical protein